MPSLPNIPEEFQSTIPNGFRVFKIRQPKSRTKSRPLWTQNEQELIRHAAGKHAMRRIQIARMYWLENKTQGQIAKALGISRKTVGSVIKRMVPTKK